MHLQSHECAQEKGKKQRRRRPPLLEDERPERLGGEVDASAAKILFEQPEGAVAPGSTSGAPR